MIELSRDGDIHIITMNDGKNTVQPEFVARMNALLDEVEAESDGPSALVLTGTDKFFCNGLDVAVVMSLQGDDRRAFGEGMSRLTRRLLAGPIPTIAAVNGHAFAAGAVLALACDYRVMREDRGWICFSEVDVGVPLGQPMLDLIRAKLPPTTARDAVLLGKRYEADAAIAAGFVDAKASEADLLAESKKLAAGLASKGRDIFSKIKAGLWADVARGFDV